MQVLKQYHIAFPDSPRKGQTVRTTAKTLQIGKVEWEEIARLVLLSSSASCQGKLRATLPKVHEAECHRAFNRHLLSAVDGGWRAAGTRAATGVRGGGGGGTFFCLSSSSSRRSLLCSISFCWMLSLVRGLQLLCPGSKRKYRFFSGSK